MVSYCIQSYCILQYNTITVSQRSYYMAWYSILRYHIVFYCFISNCIAVYHILYDIAWHNGVTLFQLLSNGSHAKSYGCGSFCEVLQQCCNLSSATVCDSSSPTQQHQLREEEVSTRRQCKHITQHIVSSYIILYRIVLCTVHVVQQSIIYSSILQYCAVQYHVVSQCLIILYHTVLY